MATKVTPNWTIDLYLPKDTLYASVALGIPQEEPYQYIIPKKLEGKAQIGRRVQVKLRNQTKIGYIVAISQNPAMSEMKSIMDVIDDETFLDEAMLELTLWMSEYYMCSWGQAIECAMPLPFKKGKTTMRKHKSKADGELVHATPRHVLTPAQEKVFDSIQKTFDSKQHRNYLLHGVTGSGKTEIYLRLIEHALLTGKGAIVLVPEISLTPQTTERFKHRFGDKVALIHSRIATGQKLAEWHRIRSGEAKVVVGARSAIFSPVKDLGFIIIDEEHDDSYKQEETPRYEAVRVAEKRCAIQNAICIKASATPLLESYHGTGTDACELVELNERILNRPLPIATIIDMRQERAGKSLRLFSIRLEDAIRNAIDQNEQVILLINRRGFAPFVNCPSCGYIAGCPECRVSMVYHYQFNKLLCHTCNYGTKPPKECPSCHKEKLRFFGTGSEKVESEAHKLFPDARIVRMDKDVTSKKDAHETILKSFRKREIDILLGTQMIAKGHDFPGVSVIGVIAADSALSIPDFRAAERTFDLITQVAGRAGRQDIEGKVFIQTFLPDNYAIQAAQTHDYKAFFVKELAFRKELNMPPFSHIIRILLSGRVERDVVKRAHQLRRHIEDQDPQNKLIVLGPAPCVISKRYSQFYWNLFYKVPDVLQANATIRKHLQTFDAQGIKIVTDVNPR